MEKFNTSKSEALFASLKECLLDGVGSSFHKSADEPYPIAFSHGKGARLYDIDGNEYIDYINGLGPMILGYSPDTLNTAVINQMEKGTHFSAPGENLLALCRKLAEIIPCAEMVSFQNSGTEANLFAFRLARAYTGRPKIVKFEGQYHGWADEEKISIDADSAEELGDTENPAKILHTPGQPSASAENIIVKRWNDAGTIERLLKEQGNEIAAIIMEPFMCDSGPILPAKNYLQEIRELTRKYGCLLIFDEVITGFHMAPGGAQEYYGVTPDLATFGKAISGGYPLAVIAGRKDIMTCGVHASGTFNANALSVAAALAVVTELSKPGVYEHFDKLGNLFCDSLRRLGEKYHLPLYCDHLGAICVLEFGVQGSPIDFRDCLNRVDFAFYGKVVQLAKAYGVRLTPRRGRLYLSTAHTEQDIIDTMQVFDTVFRELLPDNPR